MLSNRKDELKKQLTAKKAAKLSKFSKDARIKKKASQLPDHVVIRLSNLFNNTRVDVMDTSFNVKIWKTAGTENFKNNKKSTPFAASAAAKAACAEALARGAQTAHLHIYGVGVGRDAAIKTIFESGLKILKLQEIIKIAHNGVRPKKQRKA